MRLSTTFTIAGTFLVAAILCLVAARYAVLAVEHSTQAAVRSRLIDAGIDWTTVEADGLLIYLAGTAPDEAARFEALSVAGQLVDATRVDDQMLVEEADPGTAPAFSLEILRNDSGLSLIGLVPAAMDRKAFAKAMSKVTDGTDVADLLETADEPAPATWDQGTRFALRALELLPRVKISVDAQRVRVIAMAESAQARRRIESDLARAAPADLKLAMNISAPRPVVSPYSLRFVIENGTARFDACTADTEAARDRILKAAGKAGLRGKAPCTLGLGVPSPQWGHAAALAIGALGELGAGSVTFKDADIALRASPDVAQDKFDTIVGQLETSLPDVFSLKAVRPEPPSKAVEQDAPELVATLSPEGQVRIRGRMGSALARESVDSLARARFRADAVTTTARVAEGLPRGWTPRALAAVEALAYLSHGSVTMTEDKLSVRGKTGMKDAAAQISQKLSSVLGTDGAYDIAVDYQESLDPSAQVPTPQACAARIKATQSGDHKIGFEPGSVRVDATGRKILDQIARIMDECGQIRMEIAGYTDSQGREEMNQQLSLQRAQAVMDELRLRRVLTSSLSAKGYGESDPIADNGTETGREANRRIEFHLIQPEEIPQEDTGLESLAKPVDEQADKAAATDGTDSGASDSGASASGASGAANGAQPPENAAQGTGSDGKDSTDEQN